MTWHIYAYMPAMCMIYVLVLIWDVRLTRVRNSSLITLVMTHVGVWQEKTSGWKLKLHSGGSEGRFQRRKRWVTDLLIYWSSCSSYIFVFYSLLWFEFLAFFSSINNWPPYFLFSFMTCRKIMIHRCCICFCLIQFIIFSIALCRIHL